MQEQLDPHQADHLFLLIGGNPVPNAVAALTLVKEHGQITFLHTKETKPVADRLTDWLSRKRSDSIRTNSMQIHISDPQDIYNSIKKCAEEHLEVGQTVGLHYTGGTKSMAVHAHHAISDLAAGKHVFSYLDARTLRMVFDPSDVTLYGGRESVYMGIEPRFELDDLIKINGWTYPKRGAPEESAHLLPVAKALGKLNANHPEQRKALKAWLRWHKDQVGENTKSEKQVELPEDPLLKDVRQALTGTLNNVIQENQFRVADASKAAGFSSVKDFSFWFAGGWLEHLTLHALETTPRLEFHRCVRNFTLTPTPNPANQANPKFEFDVVGIRGHQLFAFSCTTSNKKKECKMKLFELYTRARQFGGDEARIALVCTVDQPARLHAEMKQRLGTDKVAVFGRQHIDGLAANLSPWIEDQIGQP